MKNFLSVIFCIFAMVEVANAQFKASPNGVVSISDKDYYVANIEGKSASELFSAVEAYIMSNFKNPDLVISSQKDKVINLRGKFTNAFYDKRTFGNYPVTVELNLVMHFKDNKIRFDTPNVSYMGIESLNDEFKFSMPRVLITGTTLFTQKGKVLDQKVIDSFNKFINDLIASIIASTNANDEW